MRKSPDSKFEPDQMIFGSEALIKTLINEDVKDIFGYPGGAIMPVYDALFNYTNKVTHVLVRHEQGAIHAAQGYAKVTGKPGVVLVTSGPGVANIVTGLADAYADSYPLVCISGQVNYSLIGSDAFQESDIIGITLPITKWNYQIKSVDEIPDVISKAFYIARSGRPGPVLIDFPKDIQQAKLNYNYKKYFVSGLSELNKYPSKELMDNLIKLLSVAKKPFLIYGNGVKIAKAEAELLQFVEHAGIPVAHTILAKGIVDNSHSLNMGLMGMHGNLLPNVLAKECDLLIAIGMRFDDRVTGNPNLFAPKAKIVHVDIDYSEVDKVKKSFYSIVGDAKYVLQQLNKSDVKFKPNNWFKFFMNNRRLENEAVVYNKLSVTNKKITMASVVDVLNKLTKGDIIVTSDVGQHQMVVSRYIKVNSDSFFITSGGLGTMGSGLPFAIGAKVGKPDKQVVAIVGDGGFQMTIQELGTIMQQKIPVKVIVLNNNYLGMVRQWQELFFDNRYSFTSIQSPDFCKVADAYNISSKKVSKPKDLKSAMVEMLQSDSAFVLEVVVGSEENVYPMIPSGTSVDETMFKNKYAFKKKLLTKNK